MNNLIADIRYGWRGLLKRPGATLIALVTLALGIGVNTAIFSAVDSVLLRPLPLHDPERLVSVWEKTPAMGIQQNQAAPANFFDIRNQNQSFAGLGAYGPLDINLTGSGDPERLDGQLVTANVFSILGVAPALGRTFLPNEDQPGQEHVVVLSDALWQRRFNRDPSIINRNITLNGESFTVVGVMPRSFFFPLRETELWTPWAMEPDQASGRGDHYLSLIGRLKPEVTLERANADLESIAQRLSTEYPRTNEGLGFTARSLHRDYVGDLRLPMLILFGAVGLVLLIACANVANLLLAQATTRRKEIAIRIALGARRWTIVRQMLVESLLLACGGGLLGVVGAFWGVQALAKLLPESLSKLQGVAIDARVLLFTLGVSVLTAIVFGGVPALLASRTTPGSTLSDVARDMAGGTSGRHVRRVLVVSEVALAVVLLVSAGLLIRSFQLLRRVEPGFKTEDALTMRMVLPFPKYSKQEARRAFLDNTFLQSVLEHRAARQAAAKANGGNAISDLDPKQYPHLVADPGGQGEMYRRRYYAPSLYLLLGVVGLVLLIACANVANLLLSRAAGRQKEIGLRLALGASRRRLIRQLLTESVLLSILGGLLGIIFAIWIKDGLIAVSLWGGEGMSSLQPRLDWRVLGFTLALSLLTGVIFGLAPAWRTTRVDLTPSLKDSGRGSSAVHRSLLSRGLVVVQVALSLLLLVGAGLFVRTLLNLQRVDPGFNTQNLLLFEVQPSLIGYKDDKLRQIYGHISERLEAVPGVQGVTFSRMALLSQSSSSSSVFLREALNATPDSEGRINPSGEGYRHVVRENFLQAMGIPLLAGRTFGPQDDTSSPKVVVVNQTFANKFFPNQSAIGKRFTYDTKKPDELEIIGVCKDAKYTSQRDDIPPTVYSSYRQERPQAGATFEVRTTGDPAATIASVRSVVREIEPNLPVMNVKSQVEQADETLRMERLFAKLLTLFALLAQQLAAIGLFGVLAYAVSQRTHEIGIRMALGADRRSVLRMIVRQGMTLAVLGVILGLVGAYVLTKYLESWISLSKMLFGVKVTDPLTYGLIAVLLTVVALIACYIPARRATKVDPLVALRYE